MKIYEVPTSVSWTGDRTGLVELQGKSPLHVAAPPELKGHPGVWTPEDLFVEALESCLMLTFVSLCEGAPLKLIGYHSRAVGHLEKGADGYHFSLVDVYPKIEVEGELDTASALLEKAHGLCMVSRSVSCKVVLHPDIMARERTA